MGMGIGKMPLTLSIGNGGLPFAKDHYLEADYPGL